MTLAKRGVRTLMDIYTSSVHQNSNKKWAWVIQINGRKEMSGAGYDTEAEALKSLNKTLAHLDQDSQDIAIKTGHEQSK